MATKLDQDFVASIKKSHANSLAGINTLVAEVKRLETIVNEAVRILKEGKARFVPNNDVDVFLAHHG